DAPLDLLGGHLFERVAVLDLVLARHQQSQDLEIGRRLRPAHLRNSLLPMHGEIPQQRANHRLAQAVTRTPQSSGRVALITSVSKVRSSGRSHWASSEHSNVRRTRSPAIARLLPVAQSAAFDGVSTFLLKPSSRMFSVCCVSVWQRNPPASGCSQLSIEIAGSPASSAAPRRFSSSSSVRPWLIMGMSRPVASIAKMSTSRLLPVPAAGDVKACSGAVGKLRRSSAVSMALSATLRSAGVMKGKSEIRCISLLSARDASYWLGCAGIGGKLSPSGLKRSPLAGS